MWGYIIGGATIFALIVGFFSIYNGRATRRLILEQERRTQEILDRIHKSVDRHDERAAEVLDRQGERLKRLEEILDRSEKLLEKLSEQHNTMVEILKAVQSRD